MFAYVEYHCDAECLRDSVRKSKAVCVDHDCPNMWQSTYHQSITVLTWDWETGPSHCRITTYCYEIHAVSHCGTTTWPYEPMCCVKLRATTDSYEPMSLSHNMTAHTTNPSLLLHETERLACHTAGQPPIPMSMHAGSHWDSTYHQSFTVVKWDREWPVTLRDICMSIHAVSHCRTTTWSYEPTCYVKMWATTNSYEPMCSVTPWNNQLFL